MKNAPPPEGLDKGDRVKYALKNNPPTLTGIVVGLGESVVAWLVAQGYLTVEGAAPLAAAIPILANKFIAQRYTVSWERWSNEHLDHDGGN